MIVAESAVGVQIACHRVDECSLSTAGAETAVGPRRCKRGAYADVAKVFLTTSQDEVGVETAKWTPTVFPRIWASSVNPGSYRLSSFRNETDEKLVE